MQTVIHPTARGAAEAVAGCLADSLAQNPRLVLGLPTGRTPVPMYRELVRLHRRDRADFSSATTFNLDEFIGLGPDDRGSYCHFMTEHFFAHVNLPRARTHVPNGVARNPRAEAERYESAIALAGGLDIVVLGIGANGHIGFNEPAPALASHTAVVALKTSSRQSNANLFGGRTARVPQRAISMGMGTILSARHIILLATGASKAEIVAKAVNGPITTRVPASLLQGHPRAVCVLDRAAARRLATP